jgi:hypothetical protein
MCRSMKMAISSAFSSAEEEGQHVQVDENDHILAISGSLITLLASKVRPRT